MQFNRLRIAGFKSFCESTEFVIEPGLTGVVGPNGCGKSNLTESLRWVMGESSYKNMRASGMDDVIFSGSGGRPARNTAEVGLVLDNADHTAPAAFNAYDKIEVTRRIERDQGSTYRVNGREVRARDVQLLFADASTGARSPAMVGQGRIGEIISARPQQRRRILEEAAGIAGLHSRRHEAELRLKAAEENLQRLEDVLREIDGQADSLRRQARQAARYRNLAGDIRRNQALLLLIGYQDSLTEVAAAERRLEADVRAVAETTTRQAETARLQAVAAHGLPPLRDAEAKAGAALHRLVAARDQLDAEEKRARERAVETAEKLAQLTRDRDREGALIVDADQVLARLDAEKAVLASESATSASAADEAAERLKAVEAQRAVAETQLAEAQAAVSDAQARRTALERAVADETGRSHRAEAEWRKVSGDRAALQAASGQGSLDAVQDALAQAEAASLEADAAQVAAEARVAAAREAETRSRTPFAEADRTLQRLETEIRTLAKLLESGSGGRWPPIAEQITVVKGFEAAIGAALGDDLDVPSDKAAAAHWGGAAIAADDAALPDGVSPLAAQVSGHPALARRLAQIGIVTRRDGARLAATLKPGQRLVSREGDLWRWDGFVAAAEAPTPAARRLVERNRLADLRIEAEEARRTVGALRIEAEAAQTETRQATAAEFDTRQKARDAQRRHTAAREAVMAAERRRAEVNTRLSVLAEAETRAAQVRDEALGRRLEADEAFKALPPHADLAQTLEVARREASAVRDAVANARAAAQSLAREAEMRTRRQSAIAGEQQSWRERRERATAQVDSLGNRIAETETERRQLAEAPDLFGQKRRALSNAIDEAEQARRDASDQRQSAENAAGDADKAARAALDALGSAREARARTEAHAEALAQRRDDVIRAIASELDTSPAELPTLAGVTPGAPLPEAPRVERTLESLKADRERLGAVNLRADEELAEAEGKRDGLARERDDLTEAIRKLRLAIQSLNREGRERLIAAFEVVNGHFTSLFTALFGGGTAELQLIESDDPLEAGLEILARPPGKKPQTMTLLSGGEQALTAMSLIFAVFLTNPSPICVLDEVDAPLDDANVERFCDLLDEMRKKTDTRFVTITHNPITMARMDRLFGVTMAERGVSQLVSVDLQTAESFLEPV